MTRYDDCWLMIPISMVWILPWVKNEQNLMRSNCRLFLEDKTFLLYRLPILWFKYWSIVIHNSLYDDLAKKLMKCRTEQTKRTVSISVLKRAFFVAELFQSPRLRTTKLTIVVFHIMLLHKKLVFNTNYLLIKCPVKRGTRIHFRPNTKTIAFQPLNCKFYY